MSKYIFPEVGKIVFATAVSNIAAPTQAEITAGTALNTPGTTGLFLRGAGWNAEPSMVDVPDGGTKHVGQIKGMTTATPATLEFYDDDASSTIRTALAEDTAGYVIIMRRGQLATKPAAVYPVTVAALNDSDPAAENTPTMFIVTFAITSKPNRAAVQAA